jgi:hypothetical protein
MQEPNHLSQDYSCRRSTDKRHGDGFARQFGAATIVAVPLEADKVISCELRPVALIECLDDLGE